MWVKSNTEHPKYIKVCNNNAFRILKMLALSFNGFPSAFFEIAAIPQSLRISNSCSHYFGNTISV